MCAAHQKAPHRRPQRLLPTRVNQQQPLQPCPLHPIRAGCHRGEHAAIDLSADRGGHRVQHGVTGQLTALPHQLVQTHVDQVGRVGPLDCTALRIAASATARTFAGVYFTPIRVRTTPRPPQRP